MTQILIVFTKKLKFSSVLTKLKNKHMYMKLNSTPGKYIFLPTTSKNLNHQLFIFNVYKKGYEH